MVGTYEDMVKQFGTGSPNCFQTMAKKAVEDRGGHCLGCEHTTLLQAKRPMSICAILRPDNLTVVVKCALDVYRKNPFRKEGSRREDCPSLTRYNNRNRQET
ncbi:MAG: hypothetical protein RL538_717 [Candidatus Parcubacteria bacterium]